MKFSDIRENSIVRGLLNNQLYLIKYWETNDIVKLERYWLYPVDENYKREISKYEPTGLRCECANHLEIIKTN
jgi:hypothetical protein